MKSILSVAALGFAVVASAHMEMTFPAPFKSKNNPNAGSDIDYGMTSPLSNDGSNFPCKGYHSLVGTDAGKPTADFQAGQTYNMTINGGAAHGGGSCQASLSFDKGTTWSVIHSYVGNCPAQGESSFDFVVPADAPSGEAIFAWTWFNQIGNREMYMNCAAVNVAGGSAKRQSTALAGRPAMFVANAGNGCTTAEGSDLEFPDPGPDVDNNSSKTAPPVGDCPSGSGSGTPAPSEPEQPEQPQQPEQPATSVATEPPAATSAPGGVFITAPPAASSEAAAPPSPSTLVTVTKSPEVPVAPAPTTPTTPSAPSTPNPVPTGGAGSFAAGTLCDSEGLWNCIGGSQFQRCASGAWSIPQAMAAGLTCTPGQSETLAFKKRSPRAFKWF